MPRLLIRPGAIGDVITSLPALESLRTGDTEIWVPSAVVPLLGHLGKVTPLSSTGLDLVELGLASTDRLQRFDSIVSWYGAARPEFRRAVASLPLSFFPALPEGCHAIDFYNAQARTLGACPEQSPRLPFSSTKRDTVAIHPFSGSPKKNWPLENFHMAAQRLGRVEWCTRDDGTHLREDLGDFARWLAGARLYIGNDSGITHLAAALGIPVIAIFVSSDPAVWSPRGPRVHVLVRPTVEQLLLEADRAQDES